MNTLSEHKKVTVGVIFNARRAWLGPEVLQAQIERKKKRDNK
jgi:hypothetical protein